MQLLVHLQNSHLRQLLIEASGGICKGAVGHKSKELRARQNGNTAEVIAYADKANTRLRSRYYKFIRYEMAQMVANKIAKKNIKVRIVEEDEKKYGYASTLHMNLDTQKIQKLGWCPQKGLDEMYMDMIAHMKKNM